MRFVPTAVALAGLFVAGITINQAGRMLVAPPADVTAAKEIEFDAATEQLLLDAAEPAQVDYEEERASSPSEAEQPATLPALLEKQEPPQLERIAPRAPLSELGLAQSPKPKQALKPEDWRPTRLFNPVATAAGLLEAQGYRVALAGVEPTKLGQDCTYQGRKWRCGSQARTAFRLWLRGRAVQCVVPPAPEREFITAECRVGKDDLSAWLIAGGWARPAEGGAYAKMFEQAKSAKVGLFGPPPKRPELIAVPRPAPLQAPAMLPAAPEPNQVEPASELNGVGAGLPAAGQFPTPPTAP